MKHLSIKHLLIAFGFAFATSAFADVHLSVNVGEPNFFGHIDINGAPRPALLLPHPVVIEHAAPGVAVEPLYLHVPLAHSRNWRRYCHQYDACGRPVYFVKDDWYRNVYVPHYRAHREEYEHHEHDHHDAHDDHHHDEHHDDHHDDHDHH